MILDTDFQHEITFPWNIEVWIDWELDTVGKVEKVTPDSVMIDGNHFVRENCKFWMI